MTRHGWGVLALVVGLVAPTVLWAGTDRRGDVGKCDCPLDEAVLVGNPINVATGNKYQAETDIAVSLLLEFTRHYNSQQVLVGGLGPYWTHSYSAKVSISTLHDGTQVADVLRATGRQLRFRWSGGGWIGDPNVPQRLASLVDGNGVAAGWEWRDDRAGLTERYAADGRLVSMTSRDGRSVVIEYGTDGELIRVRQDDGRALVFGYDTASRLASVTGPDGQTVIFSYDSVSRLSGVAYPGGGDKAYLYNEPAYTSQTSQPNALTGILHNGMRFSTYAYDASGLAISTEHAGGVRRFTVVRNPDGTATVTTPTGSTEQRSFVTRFDTPTAQSVSTACTDNCAPTTTSYQYDANGYVSQTVKAGVTTERTNDAQGRVTRRVDAVGAPEQRTVETDYHSLFGVATEQRTFDAASSLVQKSTWVLNGRGQVTSSTVTDPIANRSRTTEYAFCEQSGVDAGTCPRVGLLLSVDGPRTDIADITRYTYYPSDAPGCDTSPATCAYRKGDLWVVENAMGHISETLRYDGAGRPLQTKDANGVITDLEYHPRGWLTARKVRGDAGSGDAVMRIDYWPTGLVKQVTQPDGTFTTYAYDDAHRLTAIADNAGNKIEYTLDNAGNRIKEDTKDAQGALRRTLSRVYNQLGQLQTARDAYSVATGFSYDASGNTDTVTDAKNRVTDNDYDPLSRLTRTLQDTAGIRAETKFEYDTLDNLTRVVDPKGLATTYTYNGLGDLTQLVSPDTGTTTYTYDSAGNRASQTDARGVTTQYLYDALNRLTQILYPTISLNVTYTYDSVNAVCGAGESFALGRLARMADGSGNTQYCYDHWGNLVRKVQTTNGRVFTTRYAYNLAGRMTRMVYPSGMVVDYGLNSLGQPSSITVTRPGQAPETLVRSVKYHAFGPVSEIAYGTSGRVQRRGVDANYLPNVVEDGVSLNLGLGWDEVGNLTSLVDTHPSNAIAAPLRGFRYDPLNRLDQVRNGANNSILQTYTYDATGNRTSFKSGTSTTQTYAYLTTSHRLTQAGTIARTFDAVGNTVSIGGTAREFIFDATNRMSQLKKNGAVSMNYAYNGKGERVRRFTTATSTAQTYSVYDEAGHWIGEYSSTGAARQEYIWLNDLPVGLHAPTPASTTTFQLYHVQADHLGTPRTVIDPVRNVAVWNWALTGEAFGNSMPAQDPDADGKTLVFDMRFPGQRYDSATQLNYNYFRDYEPGTGRYVQSDPIGLDGGVSTFGYANQSPLLHFDPFGLVSVAACANPVNAAACAAAGIGVAGSTGSSAVGGSAAATAAGGLAIGISATGVRSSSANSCPDDQCQKLYATITQVLGVLKRRYWEMRADDLDLFNKKPTGRMSWAGHQQQFRGWQINLRGYLEQADAINCKAYPSDAWYWATRSPPSAPGPK